MWLEFIVPQQSGVKHPTKVVCQVLGFVTSQGLPSFILQGFCVGQVLGDAGRYAQYLELEQWLQGHGPLPLTLSADHVTKMAEFFPMGATSLAEMFGVKSWLPLSTLADRGELQLTQEMLLLLRQYFVKSSRFLQPEIAESAIAFKCGDQYFLNAVVQGELISLQVEKVTLSSRFPLDFYLQP
jgi:hypothetical protein